MKPTGHLSGQDVQWGTPPFTEDEVTGWRNMLKAAPPHPPPRSDEMTSEKPEGEGMSETEWLCDIAAIRERDQTVIYRNLELWVAVSDRTELLAHIDALAAAVGRVESEYDKINGWHDVTYEGVTEALMAVLAIIRGESRSTDGSI